MPYKQPLKSFLFQAANIIIGILMITYFFSNIKDIVQTLPDADKAALNDDNLKPNPMDYLWKLNLLKAPVDKNQLRFYADYFEHYLKVSPKMEDIHGILAYCYFYLGDQEKAAQYLKIAISQNPYYFWYYYNLGMLDISHHQYKEALELLKYSAQMNPNTTMIILRDSEVVYSPLVKAGEENTVPMLKTHLRQGYDQASSMLIVLYEALKTGKEETVFEGFKPKLHAF